MRGLDRSVIYSYADEVGSVTLVTFYGDEPTPSSDEQYRGEGFFGDGARAVALFTSECDPRVVAGTPGYRSYFDTHLPGEHFETGDGKRTVDYEFVRERVDLTPQQILDYLLSGEHP